MLSYKAKQGDLSAQATIIRGDTNTHNTFHAIYISE